MAKNPNIKLPTKELEAKKKRIREYRRKASRQADVANKRIARLEKNGLTDSPAYKTYIENGGGRFGVKGKTYNEVQKEVARMDKFINAQTSTIRGINNNLKEMAANTGITYKNLIELREKAPKFFELSDKVEQYLRQVEDMASAINYKQIWEAVNTYTREARIDLSQAGDNLDDMIAAVTNALKEYETPAMENDAFGWTIIK